MITTEIHEFKKPQHEDSVLTTITNIAENFEKLDTKIVETAQALNIHLKIGKIYPRARKIWNGLPSKDGSIGWVNIRDGKYAPTWQERTTYRLGDMVSTQSNNGHVYECIENGVSGVVQPVFPTSTNGLVFDFTNARGWIANSVYAIDSIVLSTDGNQLNYYKCIIAGTSGVVEPKWSLTSGTTAIDGSAQWQTYKTIKWKEVGASCDFRSFGQIN